MNERKKRTSVSIVFCHLSEEERIDQACEILAMGVLRLAEKQGLTKPVMQSPRSLRRFAPRDDNGIALHSEENREKKILKSEAIL